MKSSWRKIFGKSAACALLGLLSVSFGAWRVAGAEAGAAERMQQVVQKHGAGGRFSGAVLVAQRGAVVFEQAVGEANREWGIPNSPATRFRIGSITKQFAAVAVLVLAERGKLKLSDPVAAHVPEAPAHWEGITLRHLLAQTSGLPNVTRDPEFLLWKLQPTSVRQMVGRFRERPLDFAPGERHAYSNSNYLLLGLVIENASGQPLADFLREAVLRPLGLDDTGVDANLELLPRRASGYWRAGRVLNAPYTDMSVPHASGAMYSTTHDLWRWCEAVFGDKLLTPDSRRALLTPEHDGYALGVRVGSFRGRTVIEHGGNISGFSSHLRHYPGEGLTVVALSNISDGEGTPEELVRELADLALGGADPAAAIPQPVAVPRALLEQYCGTYDVGSGKTVRFSLQEGALVATPSGQEPVRVFARTDTQFYFEKLPFEVEFVRESSGAITHLLMKRDGRQRKAPRVSP